MNKTKIITAAEMADHYRPLGELYAAFKRIEKLEADNARLNDALRQAVVDAAEWAREAGEAQGKLEISEAAGVLDGWIRDCKRLEADNARLREALGEVKRLLSYANQDAVNEATAQANKNMAWRKARAALQETSHD